MKNTSELKSRYWMIILYPDSCSVNWINILWDLNVKCVVSPLHEYDLRDDGTFKKPHYHILIQFNGGRTKSSVYENIITPLKALDRFDKIYDKTSAFEYLIHKNNPEKYQYSYDKIQFINSHSYDWIEEDYLTILNYIDDNKIKSFVKLNVNSIEPPTSFKPSI